MTLTEGEDTVVYSMTCKLLVPNREGDFMATAWVDKHQQLRAEYRFRWWTTVDKLDMDGGHDDDEKQFFLIECGPDSPASREKLTNAFRGMVKLPGCLNEHEEIGSWTVKEFFHDVLIRTPMRTQFTREPR